MTRIERSALVPYTAEQMIALVEDIEAYPLFLPWCVATQVHRRTATETVATLQLNYLGVRQQFTTSNRRAMKQAIQIQLVEGPFKHLTGYWQFRPAGETGCQVALALSYQFSNRILEKIIGPVFNCIGIALVDAFVKRAACCYGPKLDNPR